MLKRFTGKCFIVFALLLITSTVGPLPAASDESAAGLARLTDSWEELQGGQSMLDALLDALESALAEAELAASETSREAVNGHLRRARNLLVGEGGEGYDETIRDPADGPGALPLLDRAAAEVDAIVEAPAASEKMRLHGGHVSGALKSARTWIGEGVVHAGYGLKAPKAAGGRMHAVHVMKWIKKAINGFDDNFNGTVERTEGGVLTAIEHARKMQ